MSIVDITLAGAFVNAIRVANEKDRLEASRANAIPQRAMQPSRRRSIAKAGRQTFVWIVKTTTMLRPPAIFRSRTA